MSAGFTGPAPARGPPTAPLTSSNHGATAGAQCSSRRRPARGQHDRKREAPSTAQLKLTVSSKNSSWMCFQGPSRFSADHRPLTGGRPNSSVSSLNGVLRTQAGCMEGWNSGGGRAPGRREGGQRKAGRRPTQGLQMRCVLRQRKAGPVHTAGSCAGPAAPPAAPPHAHAHTRAHNQKHSMRTACHRPQTRAAPPR